MKRLAAVHAAKEAYYSLKDVVGSIPATDASGDRIDPRLRFEPVADAQGMVFVARAGYAAGEVPVGSAREFTNSVAEQEPGTEIELLAMRNGQRFITQVKLIQQPPLQG